MDALNAFIQFLVDLFTALSKFLTGDAESTLDIGGFFGGLINSEDTSEVSGE